MKTKKRFLAVVLLCVLLCTFVCSGVCLIRKTLTLSLSFRGERVFEKTYPLSFDRAFRLGLYRYNVDAFCRKRFSGDAAACFGYLHPTIVADVEGVCHAFDRPVLEPTVAFSEAGFLYKNGQNGLQTDVPATFSRLLPSLNAEIAYEVLSPKETVDDLKTRTRSIALFSTSYADSSPERKKNISVAAARLSFLTVLPGEELSFNETVGARTTENGFFEAPVIENGVYTAGVGGGVCQVATTLYDAWLYADKDVAFSISLRSELVKTVPYDEYETIEGEEDRILRAPKPSELYHSYRVRTYPNGQTEEEFLRASFYLPQKGKKSVSARNNDEENGSQ